MISSFRTRKLVNSFVLLALLALPSYAQTLDEARQAYDQERYEEALTMLETIVKADRKNADAFLLLGQAALRLDNLEKAAWALEKAVSLDKEFLGAYVQLGFLYEKMKHPGKAAKAWQKALAFALDKETKELAQKHLDNLR